MCQRTNENDHSGSLRCPQHLEAEFPLPNEEKFCPLKFRGLQADEAHWKWICLCAIPGTHTPKITTSIFLPLRPSISHLLIAHMGKLEKPRRPYHTPRLRVYYTCLGKMLKGFLSKRDSWVAEINKRRLPQWTGWEDISKLLVNLFDLFIECRFYPLKGNVYHNPHARKGILIDSANYRPTDHPPMFPGSYVFDRKAAHHTPYRQATRYH